MENDDIFLRIMKNFAFFMFGIMLFPLVYVIFTGDYPGAAVFYGYEEDHGFVDWVFDVREFFTVK